MVFAYQYRVFAEIAQERKEGSLTSEMNMDYRTWLRCEHVLDNATDDALRPKVEEERKDRFAKKEHYDFCTTPAYLFE